MSKKRLYYKAIDERKGTLRSAVTHSSKWEVRYRKGIWVKGRHGSLLFIFATKEDALKWVKYESIWECEVKEVRVVKWMGHWGNPSTWLAWWKTKSSAHNSAAVHAGTRMCKAVKLVKRVVEAHNNW